MHGTSFDVPKFSATDLYCAVVVTLPLLVVQALLWLPFTLLALPTLVAFRLYLSTLPRPLRRIDGPWCSAFGMLKVITFIGSIPALAMLSIWTALVWVWSTVSSLPYGITVRCLGQKKWRQIGTNLLLMLRYTRRPRWGWGDLCRAAMGSMDRQGFTEFVFGKPFWGVGSLLLAPVFKYALQCNMFLDELEPKFVNEWSDPPKPDLALDALDTFTTTFVCTALHSSRQRSFVDQHHTFAAHYPYPPDDVRPVTGMQFSERDKGVFLTRVVHRPSLETLREAGAPIMGDDVLRCIFHVQLLYSNPFHPLVGDVFVNVTRQHRVEHQMHCLASKSTYLGNRALEASHRLFGTSFLRGAMQYLEKFGLEP
jgi:hypothetical protein